MSFHWRDGLYFTRLNGGAVRIRRFKDAICPKDSAGNFRTDFPADHDAGDVLDVVVPGMEWVSIVASVSGQETREGYDRARDLHLWAGGDV